MCVFFKPRKGRKEQIIKQEKKGAVVNGVNTFLDLIDVPDWTRNIRIYPNEPKFGEQEKNEKVSISIHDNGIHATIIYPTGIRLDYNRSTKSLPKGLSLARAAAEAWALGKHTPASIAAYIETELKEHIITASK
jgi:hypothetical protein